MPQPNTDQILQGLIAQKLGEAAPQAAAPGAPAVPGAPATPPKSSDAPTQQEQGAAKGAPADAGSEPSFEFVTIDDGEGGKRELTHQQIKGTMDRYRDLNHKWQTEVAPMKGVLEVAKRLMEMAKTNGYDAKPNEISDFVAAAVKAYTSNPQMGGDGKKAAAPTGKMAQAPMNGSDGDGNDNEGAGDDDLSSWEKENAVKLPPGYKATMETTKGLSAKMDQIMQLLSGAMGEGGSMRQAQAHAGEQIQAAQGAQFSAAKQAVTGNIKQAMMNAKMTPEDLPDFQAFAQARGYSPEDFIDADLTSTVVNDFAANRQAPEIARLREIAQRRQAFTGSGAATPGGAGAAPAAPADPMFAKLAQQAMQARNL